MTARITVLVVAITAAICPLVVAGPAPTRENVIYSKSHERCTLDVWLPQGTTSSCPMVVFFHGGSFTGGNKSEFKGRRILSEYFVKGVAFASVNYPLLEKANGSNIMAQAAGYLDIMAKAADSIRFLKTQAEEWNVDPARIAVMGSSAGAMIAEHLAYWENLGITGCFAQEQPYRSLYILVAVKKGHPPLILYTRSGVTDEVHNPEYARKFKAYFDSVGVKCELYGSPTSGLPALPQGVSIEKQVMRLFSEQWQSSAATATQGIPKDKTKHNGPNAGAGK